MGGCASVFAHKQPEPGYEGVMNDHGKLIAVPQDVQPEHLSPTQSPNEVIPLSNDLNGPDLTILHFNDSHNLIPSKLTEPIGGAARFATLAKKCREEKDCLVLFSGDVFNPSRLSTVTKGKHIGPIMKVLRPDCGVYGNHDFDFGVEELVKLAQQCDMPWVMTNVVDTSTDPPVPIAKAQKHHVLFHNGIIVGIIGIVEQEWLDTIRDLPSYVQYLDKVSAAKEEIRILRNKGAQFIIALSHMREYNDRAFLKDVPEVDLLLGGHDHYYLVVDVEGRKLVKSSADFMHTTCIEVWLPAMSHNMFRDQACHFRLETTQIPIVSAIEEDAEVKGILDSFDRELALKLNKELCRITRELDVMAESVRVQEAAAGNWIADIMRKEMHCDVAIVNSGVLRADLIYLPGVLKLKDILDILPMEDIVVSILVSGFCLKEALECGFSKYPAKEGRFPQVSGMRILMDHNAKPMERVRDILIGNSPLKPNKCYKLATTSYLSTGGDGYAPLKEGKYIVEIENGLILPTMVRQHLTDLPGKQQRLERRQSLMNVKEDPRLGRFERDQSLNEIRKAYLPIVSPQVEGRIIISDLYSSFRAMNGVTMSTSCSSLHSDVSSLIGRTRPLERRTSMAHPISIKRTMNNLKDMEYAHEHQVPDAMHWDVRSSDGASACRPSTAVTYLQAFASTSEMGDLPYSNAPSLPSPAIKVLAPTPRAKFLKNISDVSARSVESFRLPPGPELGQSVSSSSLSENEGNRRTSALGNIYDAAAKGDLDGLQMMLKTTKVLLNKKGMANVTAVESLKAAGLGTTGRDVGTPLHFAIAFGRQKAVEFLLDQGSDPRECTQMGGNARELAYAHLVKAHSAGNAAMVKIMESILNALKYHEENMTEEQRFMMYK